MPRTAGPKVTQEEFDALEAQIAQMQSDHGALVQELRHRISALEAELQAARLRSGRDRDELAALKERVSIALAALTGDDAQP